MRFRVRLSGSSPWNIVLPVPWQSTIIGAGKEGELEGIRCAGHGYWRADDESFSDSQAYANAG
jgi:hypothetical protein